MFHLPAVHPTYKRRPLLIWVITEFVTLRSLFNFSSWNPAFFNPSVISSKFSATSCKKRTFDKKLIDFWSSLIEFARTHINACKIFKLNQKCFYIIINSCSTITWSQNSKSMIIFWTIYKIRNNPCHRLDKWISYKIKVIDPENIPKVFTNFFQSCCHQIFNGYVEQFSWIFALVFPFQYFFEEWDYICFDILFNISIGNKDRSQNVENRLS